MNVQPPPAYPRVTYYICCTECWRLCDYDMRCDRHVCSEHGPIITGAFEHHHIRGGKPSLS